MKSNVNITDHPLHPMLVLIPAGAWITSFVLDIIFLASGATFWFIAAMWVMVIGIAGAVLAALAGFTDLFTLPMTNEPKRTGLEHMWLNLLITVLYIINVAAVRAPVLFSPVRSTGVIPSDTTAWGFILNIVSILLLVVSGWLGGDMVYRFGIAVPRETMERAHRYETAGAGHRTAESGALGGERPASRDQDEEQHHREL